MFGTTFVKAMLNFCNAMVILTKITNFVNPLVNPIIRKSVCFQVIIWQLLFDYPR